MDNKIVVPLYSKIALDIASRIRSGELKEGAKISGRSVLASEYRVSPETIRRSMFLLRDMDIIDILHGSGIYIKSKENAAKYVERFNTTQSIYTIKRKIKELIEEDRSIQDQIITLTDNLVYYSEHLKYTNTMNPVEFEIKPGCHLIGKSISDSKFWQNTGATIVAIVRGSEKIISPGPYNAFMENDIFLAIGDEFVLQRINDYINQ